MAMREEEGEEQKQNIRVRETLMKKFMHAKNRQKNIHALAYKKTYKGNTNEKNSCDFSIMKS